MAGQGEIPTSFLSGENPRRTPDASRVINSEAQFIAEIDDTSVDAIVFDPPYEANVNYAELSDFFYVWLKRTVGHLFQTTLEDISQRRT